MNKKMFKGLLSLSAMLLLSALFFAGCDLSSDNIQQVKNKGNEPIHSIELEDDGEIVYFLTDDGYLVTSMTSKSDELLEELQNMSVLEICNKYGDGVIPDALQKACEEEAAAELEYKEALKNERLNESTMKYNKGSNIMGPFPNWDYYTFQTQALKCYPYDNDPAYYDWGDNGHGNRIRNVNHIGFFYTALYVKSGLVHHKLREHDGSHSELYSREVKQGYFSIMYCYRTTLAWHRPANYSVFYNAKIAYDSNGNRIPSLYWHVEMY